MKYEQFDSMNQDNNAFSDNETTAATLAVLGGLLSTLGDAISTFASVLALQDLQRAENDNNDNNERINELEKQIQYLMKEINQQKMRK